MCLQTRSVPIGGRHPLNHTERWRPAAGLIRSFADCALTNDEFESAFEDNAGGDRVLFEIGVARAS